MSRPADLTVFIVATAPQAGKSTVAALVAELLETEWVSSSAPVSRRVEERLGLEPGTIAAARALDPDRFRPELIAEGDRMTAEGLSPGVLCVRQGHRVIDGIRRESELRQALAETRRLDRRALVICVRRATATGTDNTQAEALRALADVDIVNDGSLSELAGKVERALAALARAA